MKNGDTHRTFGTEHVPALNSLSLLITRSCRPGDYSFNRPQTHTEALTNPTNNPHPFLPRSH